MFDVTATEMGSAIQIQTLDKVPPMEKACINHLDMVAIEKGAFGSPSTKVANFNFTIVYNFLPQLKLQFLFHLAFLIFDMYPLTGFGIN